jgi:Cys-tRNA(Pro)/Cys-tRNA(Cys) deacylase
VDPEDLAAEVVAAKIGLPPGQLFKTLVAEGDRHGICVAVIPGDAELDLKALALASGDRKIRLVPVKELQKLTGYTRGGVTALAAKKAYPVYADKSIRQFEVISISAGVRGIADSPGARRLSEGRECNAVPDSRVKGLSQKAKSGRMGHFQNL